MSESEYTADMKGMLGKLPEEHEKPEVTYVKSSASEIKPQAPETKSPTSKTKSATPKTKLSAKEEEIMACFWQHGPLFVREVVGMLAAPKPHFNTVSTFVRNLEAKGWLSHEQIGNSYRYFAAVGADDYRERSLRGIVSRFFGNSYLNFVSALVRDDRISTDELREFIAKIEGHGESGDRRADDRSRVNDGCEREEV